MILKFYFFKVEYKIKWENYDNRYNTWEKEENLTHCEEALREFEIHWAKEIVGVKNNICGNGENINQIQYLLKFRSHDTREIQSDDAKLKWPKLTIAFLEKSIIWRKHSQQSKSTSNSTFTFEEANNPACEPIKIICEYFFTKSIAAGV